MAVNYGPVSDGNRYNSGGSTYSNPLGSTGTNYTPAKNNVSLPLQSAGIIDGINYGLLPNQKASAKSIDDIIRQSKPVAEDILRAGTDSALNFSRGSQANVEDSLSQFLNPQALEEQASLLGARGSNAQQAAIANIPVSAAQVEADRRERVGMQRRAAAGGELGAGSTMLASGQLAGQQQTNRVANRIEQLEQLAGIDRQLIGDISRNRESELSRQSALQAGLGGQIANVGFGLAGPAVESIQTQAEISGLRGIASAQRSADNASAMANLAGQVFTPSNITSAYNTASNFFSPAEVGPTYIPTQAGRTNVNFSPAGSGNLNYSPTPQIQF